MPPPQHRLWGGDRSGGNEMAPQPIHSERPVAQANAVLVVISAATLVGMMTMRMQVSLEDGVEHGGVCAYKRPSDQRGHA